MVERSLSNEDIEDFLAGASVFGTGGGGGERWARTILAEAERRASTLRLVDVDSVPDDSFVFGVAGVGGGVAPEVRERYAKLPRLSDLPAFLAAQALQRYVGGEPFAYVPFELGPGNTVLPMVIASFESKPCVDGDTVGRAVPEVGLDLLNVKKVTPVPYALASPFGDTVIGEKALDHGRVEDISRSFAVACGGGCGFAQLVRGDVIKKAVIPGTVSRAMKVGRAIRRARARGEDAVEALLDSAQAVKMFEGRVREFEREGKGGFVWGSHTYEGTGAYAGRSFRIWYKNEHQVLWEDGEPLLTCPDLVCVVDAKTALGLSNWGDDFAPGREVACVGIRAPDAWRSEEGLALYKPRHFGFDMDCKLL